MWKKEIVYNTEVLKSYLCDCNVAYIFAKDDIIAVTAESALLTKAAFKNCVPFTKCIVKMDGTTIEDAEDLVIPM